MSNIGNWHYSWGIFNNLRKKSLPKTHDESWRHNRRPKANDLRISVNTELTTIGKREISDVRRKMQGLNRKSIKINGRVRKGTLHSILFDNINNKADHQILGVILDACNHFVRKNRKDSRYITFSSGLNKFKSKCSSQNETLDTGICDSGFGKFSGFRLKKKYNFCLVALLAVAMCFFVSCGGGSKTGDNADTGDTVTDNDTGDSGSSDTEPGGNDTESTENHDSDNPDTAPDAGDSDTTPDNDADSGDTAPDSDNEEPVNENPDNFPECSPTSATPCIDSETGLIWSGKSAERIRWIDAVDYCKNLKEGGYNDWLLPSIAVLETLVKQCVSSGYSDGECSKFGDIVFFWSSNQGQGVFFYDGATQTKNVDENFDARCVRREIKTRKATCTGLPEHAEWNTVSEITQTWNWETADWSPEPVGKYGEYPSTAQCQFKCEENLFWSEYYSICVDYDTTECAKEDIVMTAKELSLASPEYIQERIKKIHNNTKSYCSDGTFVQKDRYDTNGNLCIEDECHINPDNLVSTGSMAWIDDLVLMIFDGAPMVPPKHNILYYKKVESMNKGGPTDLTIKKHSMTIYAKNIPTTSCFSPNNVVDNASTITMSIGYGCYWDEQSVSPSNAISTKNIQTKMVAADFEIACNKVPNSQYNTNDELCSTTITEFAWLENVVPYLHSKSGIRWTDVIVKNAQIEKDVNNNVFRMYFSINDKFSWIVDLPNAKRCLDECYGIEGCEVSINPSANISNGCNVKEPGNN